MTSLKTLSKIRRNFPKPRPPRHRSQGPPILKSVWEEEVEKDRLTAMSHFLPIGPHTKKFVDLDDPFVRVKEGVLRRFDIDPTADPPLLEPGTGRTLLHVAILHGRNRIVKDLAQRGLPVDVQDKNGETAMGFLIRLGRGGEVLRVVFRASLMTPASLLDRFLKYCSRRSIVPALQFLLAKYGGSLPQETLVAAARTCGSKKWVGGYKTLCRATGTWPQVGDLPAPLPPPPPSPTREFVREVWGGRGPLASGDRAEVAEALDAWAAKGARIGACEFFANGSALHWAVYHHNLALVQELLARGYEDVNVPAPHTGSSPLFWAERKTTPEIAAVLRDHGAVSIPTNVDAILGPRVHALPAGAPSSRLPLL